MERPTWKEYPWKAAFHLIFVLGGAGLVLMIAGFLLGRPTLWMVGALLVVSVVVMLPRRAAVDAVSIEEPNPAEKDPAPRPTPACSVCEATGTGDVESLVQQMLAQDRYTLLLRPQIVANLDEAQFAKVIEALWQHMTLVPDGEVTLGPADEISDDEMSDSRAARTAKQHVVRVKRFFLDRYPVTNRQYFEFVAGGGYQQMSLWDETVLAAVLDFVDRTGEPGPRFWKNGCFLEGTEDHPVVGVCWHEAVAYAHWVGKRLPSDAEWVKAGVWPVPVANQHRIQRKYPWGDDMDRSRANLWGSGPGGVVGIREFSDGVSVGGVHQLIGNVWEWTNSNFHGGEHPFGKLTFMTPMKSIRGGAFDTYFENQATCQFQSGDSALARKRNVGFRLAIGVCDLVLDYSAVAPSNETDRYEDPVPETAAVDVGDRGENDDEMGHPEVARGEEVPA
ncbi:MAG: SUMF1/EgtB/PvdO family nonheme iron enzyme [Pirellulales bacterium]|nr:SUMF1/EgtB/PvdO family nonheme iron enzyme [Pirellulales bacterium]